MYCKNCGNVLSEGAQFCDKCGAGVSQNPQGGTGSPVQNGQAYQGGNASTQYHVQSGTGQYGNPYDAPSGGMAVLGFFFPIIGLILYLVWKDEKPLRAHSAGKGALIGVIAGVVLYILGAVLPFAFLFSAF